MANLDDWNYYGDSRVVASMTTEPYKIENVDGKQTVVFNDSLIESFEEEELDVERSAIVGFELCPGCAGKGTMVNPSIDAGGISAEDFAEDPDFAEAYFSGTYDVGCSTCDGRTSIPVVKFHGPNAERIQTLIDDWYNGEEDYASECAMELRLGC